MVENSKQENRIILKTGIVIEAILLIMMLVIAVRLVSYISVTKLGVNNELVVEWSKGIDLSTTVSVEDIANETNFFSKFKKIVNKYTGMVESLCTASFPLSEYAHNSVDWIDTYLLNNNLADNSGVYGVSAPATESAESIITFMNYLESNELPHVYVHTPYIESVRYYNNDADKIERWDTVNGRERFLDILDNSGLEYIDVYRDKESYELTYDSSNHWQSKDALFTAKLTADYLNKKYDARLDTDKLIPDLYVNIVKDNEVFQNTVNEVEGFRWQYLVPKDKGNYLVERDGIEKSGSFDECFINPTDEWRTSEEVYHNVCGLNNGTPYHITNNSIENGSKCLIIGDSFAWPFYSYMAQEYNFVTAIWNFTEGFSYYDYIDEWKPDAVIVILNDCQLSGDYHFDFNK